MENVVYITKTARQASQEAEFAALAAQIEDCNKCSTMQQLITVALSPNPAESQQAK